MWSDLVWQQPAWFLLTLPIAGVMLMLWLSYQKQLSLAGQGIIAPHLARVFSVQGRRTNQGLPIVLTLLGTACIVTALAGPSVPVGNKQSSDVPLVVAFDLSDSMTQTGSGLSALEQGQSLLNQLLQQGVNRPVSLMAYAGSAHAVLPPTKQLALVQLYLSYLSPEVMPQQGSNLSTIMANIAELKNLKEDGFDLLVFTDGGAVDSEKFNAFLSQYKAQGAIVWLGHTVPTAPLSELNLQEVSGVDISASLSRKVAALNQRHRGSGEQMINLGYWLLIPFALILLYFFRPGFNLHWAYSLLLAASLMPPPAQAAWLDWWLTPDQQGAYFYRQGEFEQAAQHFADPQWRGAALVAAKKYPEAIQVYQQSQDVTGLYNLATAYAKARNYQRALDLYQLVQQIEPDTDVGQKAQKNSVIITRLIDEIQRMSESQQEENPDPKSIDPDEMTDTSLGADKQRVGKIEVKVEQLSVDEILANEGKKEQWLRDISRDPKQFLAAKFQADYQQQLAANTTGDTEQTQDAAQGAVDE
ncbi:vWA domain-containing protein [Motilimonas pumila]|uniref:VWA domain-containing protein n=1 Tax=Motilimonas pumila TaxID=2303987 RepID=A0A418YHV0_9GAMM|nr:tetratricopeptide repeat protein [Motilimonas pumila]RJG49915.1 VWA domain-containing protein [Motilimonas pumila]